MSPMLVLSICFSLPRVSIIRGRFSSSDQLRRVGSHTDRQDSFLPTKGWSSSWLHCQGYGSCSSWKPPACHLLQLLAAVCHQHCDTAVSSSSRLAPWWPDQQFLTVVLLWKTVNAGWGRGHCLTSGAEGDSGLSCRNGLIAVGNLQHALEGTSSSSTCQKGYHPDVRHLVSRQMYHTAIDTQQQQYKPGA